MPPSAHSRIARAPGRVNLIGEHIDYHGLPVLPMALGRAVTVRFTPRNDGVVSLANRDPSFAPVTVPVHTDPERGPDGDWGNYVRAAVAAVTRLAPPGGFAGFDGVVDSDLPAAAGLSSSSALVVATALALLDSRRDRAWHLPSASQLAGLLARGERYVGTAGGGMDQAASLGGVAGAVLRVTFEPVAWTPRSLPAGWAVLVGHTGVRAEKSGAARDAYNELRLRGERARDVLARALGTPSHLGALRAAASTAALTSAARRLLEPATAEVAVHVLTEADRVDGCWEALAHADLQTFARAMNDSHASLTERCGVGHPRLDALVRTAREAGAAGARLTGAGFGGSIVAVARDDDADRIQAALRRRNRDAGLDPAAAPVFRAWPGEGARVRPDEDRTDGGGSGPADPRGGGDVR